CEHEGENHWHRNHRGECNNCSKGGTRRRQHGSYFHTVQRRDRERAHNPNEAADTGGDIWTARRAVALGLQDLADAGTVIISGRTRRGLAIRPAGLRCLVGEQLGALGRRRDGRVAVGGWSKRRFGGCLGWRIVEGFLDGGGAFLGRFFCFLGNIRHTGRRLVFAPVWPPGPERNDGGFMPSARHCCGKSSRKLPALSPSGHPIALSLRK